MAFLEALENISKTENNKSGHILHRHNKEENFNEDEEDSAHQVSAVRKMRVVDYLRTSLSSTTFESKNGTKKIAKPPYPQITPYESKEVEAELAAFHIYITEHMLQTILNHTNEEIKISQYYVLPKSNCGYPLNLTELKAFIGILFLSAVKKDNTISTALLWGVWGSDIYSTVMSKDRFEHLIKCLRFDDYTTRETRKKHDYFTEIREIWQELNKKCSEVFRPSANCNIDELFVEYNGKCSYEWPLPKQPQKSDIRLILLCDTVNRYIISGILHKNDTRCVPEHVIEKLVKPVRGMNINITYSNCGYTSISLSRKMLNMYKLTTVAPLHRSLSEIPYNMTVEKNRIVGTSILFYNKKDKVQICSHYSKKGEVNIFLSTKHCDSVITEANSKPGVIEYYESTKSGVDAINKMCQDYSCSRQTTCWFLAVFFTILDFAGINAFTNLNLNRARCGKPSMKRVDFLYKLALDLMLPYMKERIIDPNTSESLKNKMNSIIEERQNLNMECNNPQKTVEPVKKSTNQSGNQNGPVNLKIKAKDNLPILKLKEMQVKYPPGSSGKSVDAKQSYLWKDIRAMYPPSSVNNRPVVPNICTDQYNNMVNLSMGVFQANNLPPTYIEPAIIQLLPIAPYHTYFGWPPQIIYVKQIQALYPYIQPLPSIVPYLNKAWSPAELTIQQIRSRYQPTTRLQPIRPTGLIPNLHQFKPKVQVQQIKAKCPSNQPVRPIQQNNPVLNTQQKSVNLKIQQISVINNVTDTPNQLSMLARKTESNLVKFQLNPEPHLPKLSLKTEPKLPELQVNTESNIPMLKLNTESEQPKLQLLSQPSLPTEGITINQSRQTNTEWKKELCVCGICNYIGDKNFFMECSKCSVLLCMVHRETVCTNCFKSTQGIGSLPALAKRAKCGICKVKGLIKYSTKCTKCSTFLCLEHRRMVCLFCIEE